MSRWMPIETAPKDGTRIVLGNPDWLVVWSGSWLAEQPPGEPDYRWNSWGPRWERTGFCDRDLNPTHWQPLPSPPEE